jgi:hypothetical protein
MNRWVHIEFDCLPLRSVTRWDAPLDASPAYQALCAQVKQAHERHGSHNSYFLYRAKCRFHLTNRPDTGMLEFTFHGVVLTDDADRRTRASDLTVKLSGETCAWLTEPVVRWFEETVQRAVEVEFDRYIDAGDLHRTRQRIEKLQAECDQQGGFLGMYL